MTLLLRLAPVILLLFAVNALFPSQARSQTPTVLHSFSLNGADGSGPTSSLIVGPDGNQYGTTSQGGRYGYDPSIGLDGYGTIFKITPGGVVSVLHSFNSADGQDPEAGLTAGPDGALYGTTFSGGQYGYGTVFKITTGGVFTLLYSFGGTDTDGMNPEDALVVGHDNNLYGTTPAGGLYGYDNGGSGDGTVFRITTAGVETVLHSFSDNGTDGAAPNGLVVGADGALYGTTLYGGQNDYDPADGFYGDGSVFKLTTSGGADVVLHSFGKTAADGLNPTSALVLGADARLYGTTPDGGETDDGIVYQITTRGAETILHTFGGSEMNGDGAVPQGALVVGSDGSLYGTTSAGGENGYNPNFSQFGDGTVFNITPGGAETALYSFDASTVGGYYPQSGLVLGADGNLYGTTFYGGVYSDGAAYKVTIDHLVVTAPATAKAGTPINVKVSAVDAAGKADPGYSGVVRFTSTDTAALLPANAYLTNGVGTFRVTFKTAKAQTVTARDTVIQTIASTSTLITVGPGPVGSLTYLQSPTAVAAGGVITPAPTIRALDAYGNLATGSAVTVSLASGNGALGGTLTQTADATGIAAFPGLTVSRPGAKTLKAASVGTSASVVSVPFNVTADDKLTAAGVAVSAVKRVSFHGAVATFTDADKASPATDFTASLTWGDGTAATAGTVGGSGGAFTVDGTHTYATEGAYTVSVTVTDTQLGGPKASTTAKATVKDATAPTTTAKLSPAAPNGLDSFYKSAVTLTLSATDPDNAAGELTTFYSVDGGAQHTYTAQFTVSTDGSHTVTYHSVDKAGNAETAKTVTFKIDATAPVTTATATKVTSGEQVTLSAADAVSGVSSTVYSLDGATAKTYTGAFTVSVNGSHTVTYHCTDKAGNVEAAKTLKITVAVALPVTTASLSGTLGATGYYQSAAGVTLKTMAGGLAVSKRYYQLDGGASAAYTAPLSVTGDKTHTVTFYAVDSAGNAETPKTVTFKIDAIKPATTATATKVTSGEQVTLSATDDYSGVLARYYAVDGGAQQTYTAPFTVTGAGSHTVTYHSVDKAGNSEATKTLKFTE